MHSYAALLDMNVEGKGRCEFLIQLKSVRKYKDESG
jgi:hypothetical protein